MPITTKKKRLAVIFGGQSGEHEVSLKSANQIMLALDKNKYKIIPIAITKSGHWLVGTEGREYLKANLKKSEVQGGVKKEVIAKNRNKFPKEFPPIDLVLPIMHGPLGEDGRLQGALEMLNLPYVFSGVLASALAMNKKKTKIIARTIGIKTAKDLSIFKNEKYDVKKIIAELGFPVVIKPVELGSSVGTSLAKSGKELLSGIDEALEYGDEVLLEQFIKGRELTVAVMENKTFNALPVIEIIPKISGWFDYRAKYEKGGSQEICPAKIPEKIRQKIQLQAVEIFKAIGCLDLARADFIWSELDEELYFLEINTIPGMTATSLTPQPLGSLG